jgi:hypothetical protein
MITGLTGSREHQDHHPVVAIGDHLAKRVAVDTRQIAVEHHDVVAVDTELGCGLETVVRGIDGHALISQALD